tara:strand:+ start:2777 stop:2995 length:219 start_codon:yes stop_codon:yes gene_type:complete
MLNLDKELKMIASLGETLKSTIEKTEIEINNFAPKEGEQELIFIKELKEVLSSGKGIEELQEKVKQYENNRK